MKYILILLSGLFILLQINVKAQCVVDANAYPSTICLGQSVNLKAFGACNFLMNNDFNNQSLGVGWSSTAANPVFSNPCGNGPNGPHAWVGTTAATTRTLETQQYNVSIGGCKVDFFMRYGRVENAGPCEDPDAANEGVHLQYSINGTTWQDFPGPNLNPTGNNSITGPFITIQDGLGGYWQPESNTSSQLTSSLYYWNHYSCPVPAAAATNSTKFRWAQLSSSSTGYDAWGIDQVEILCPDTNTVVEWKDQSGNVFSNTLMAGNVTPTQSQWYYVTITDTLSGSFAVDSVYITVNPIPNADFNISDTSICMGDSIMVSYTGQSDSTATFDWDFDGVQENVTGPYIKNYPTAGIFPISLAINDKGCQSQMVTHNVYVNPNPLISFSPDVFKGCQPLTVNFTNSSIPANSNFIWYFGDGKFDNVASPSHTYPDAGVYDVRIQAITQEGCMDSITLPGLIKVYQNPTASFESDYYITSFKNPYVNLTNLSLFADSSYWDFDDGTDFTGANPGQHTFPGEGTYNVCLFVSTIDGCNANMCREIQVVVDKIQVPNVITPNTDGWNDILVIENIEKLKSSKLSIYNRWGKKVFESENYQNNWDGDNHPDGTYFWTLDYTTMLGDIETMNGTLTILSK